MQDLILIAEHGGSIGLIALFIFKLPALIDRLNVSNKDTVTQVRDAQDKALAVLEKKFDYMITAFDRRFEAVERHMQEEMVVLKELALNQTRLMNDLENLKKEK